MSEWEGEWSDNDDDDRLSWKSLCVSDRHPAANYYEDDTESMLSLQDIASEAHFRVFQAPPQLPAPLMQERELVSFSQWVFPPQFSATENPRPADISPRIAEQLPVVETSVPRRFSPTTMATPAMEPTISLLDHFAKEAPIEIVEERRFALHEQLYDREDPISKEWTEERRVLEAKLRAMEDCDREWQSKCSSLEMKLKTMTDRLHDAASAHLKELRGASDVADGLKAQIQAKDARIAMLQNNEYEHTKIASLLEAKIDSVTTLASEKERKIQMDADLLAVKSNELHVLQAKLDASTMALEDMKDKVRQTQVEMDRLRKDYSKVLFELNQKKNDVRVVVPPPPPVPGMSDRMPSFDRPSATIAEPTLINLFPPTNSCKNASSTSTKSLAELGFKIVRKPDEINSSANVRNLLSYQVAPPPSSSLATTSFDSDLRAPFATEKQSFQNDVVEKRELESQLLQWHIQKEQLQAEYSKLEQMGFRTIDSRRRKSDIESRLQNVDRQISQLKFRLR
ncbi:Aste57867_24845 [Aphanomyces stellatus]|uniref:Aste57867_24845 protein n=1 Tax=Aphanomyces stellatus TaxID=120398 RepID=A0A485LS60_9STRA|nr:hypothetical protein As57867_024767 [Aphanomyces stellatus]VFU01479.1 Aste57867_24845 [Aphanomyces stellatus]